MSTPKLRYTLLQGQPLASVTDIIEWIRTNVGPIGFVTFKDIQGDLLDNPSAKDYISTLTNMVEALEKSKQDTLIAGQNITIVDNVISATGGQGGYEPDRSTIVLDGKQRLSVNDYVSASAVQGSVALLQQSITNLDAKKQDTLTAGQNITIRDNVISASGTVSVEFANLSGSPFDNQALSKELTYLKDKVAELEAIVANCAKLDADNNFTGYNKFSVTAPKVVTGDEGRFWICKNDNESKTPSISIQPQKNVNEYTTLYINAYAHPYPDYELTLPNKSGMIATLDDIEQLKKELQGK